MNVNSVFVYDEFCKNSSYYAVICNYLVCLFSFRRSNFKCLPLENFNPEHYDNSVVYFLVDPSKVEQLIETFKLCTNVFNAYIFVCVKDTDPLKSPLTVLDCDILTRRADYYGIFLSCIVLTADTVHSLNGFLDTFNNLNFLEHNTTYFLCNEQSTNRQVMHYKALGFNIFLNKSNESCYNFKSIASFNNIKISSLLKNTKCKNIPQIALQALQESARLHYTETLFLNHYFDKVYVLHLKRRHNNTLQELKKLGIWNYCLFEGFDGESSIQCIQEYAQYMQSSPSNNETKLLHNKRRGISSVGSWAILKSMHNLLVDAKSNNYKRILVLQDDVIFHIDFAKEFKRKLDSIDDENWKLLYLGASQHEWNSVDIIHDYYHPVGTTDGAFAVGIDMILYEELIKEITLFDMPFDSGALWAIQRNHKEECYVLYENIVIADLRHSDLRVSRDMSKYALLFKWNLENFEITD